MVALSIVWPERRRWHCDNGDGDVESDIVGAIDVDGIGDPPILRYNVKKLCKFVTLKGQIKK